MKKTIFSKSNAPKACMAALLLLVGCEAEVQDTAVVSEDNQVFAGRAIDGYIARATVFIDGNNNGTRDAWEAWAFTDDQGYFSYNALTNTDYCASTSSAQQAQYCLVSPSKLSEAVLRIDSGYDTLTGEPFVGQLSRRVTSAEKIGENSIIISPLSSLMTDVNTRDRELVLQALDIHATDLDVDYLATSNAKELAIFNTSVKIHKTVTILSDRLTDIYTEVGNDFDTPNDATAAVYRSLAEEIIQSATQLNTVLASHTALSQVIKLAEDEMQALYQRKDYTMPSVSEQQKQDSFDRVIDITNDLAQLADQLILPSLEEDLSNTTGSARLIEVLALKTLNEKGNNDATVDSMVEFFERADSNLVNALIEATSSKLADISSLVKNDFSGNDFDSEADIIQAAQLPSDAKPFSNLGGMTLRISDLDLGTAPFQVDDSEAEFYFSGDNNALNGNFKACVKFIDDANAATGELGEGNTRGELVEGFWSLLGGTSNTPESYSLLLTISLLETTYQAILKPAGETTIDGVSYTATRVDLDGEYRKFHSNEWLQKTNSIPSNNTECETRLPSRVEL